MIASFSIVVLLAAGISARSFESPLAVQVDDIESLVVGGENASKGEFPHQVQLKNGGRHYCGGSILTKDWILTAAHCITGRIQSYEVVAGELDTNVKEGTEQASNVSQLIKHPKYGTTVYDFDVGLVKLIKPLKFNDFVKPVQLWRKEDGEVPLENAIVSGWGMLSWPSGKIPNHLQKVITPIIDLNICKGTSSGRHVTDNMLCVGYYETGGKGVCKGDSGGPLLTLKNNSRKQVGIVSWTRLCATPKHPAVYASVPKFQDFIREHVPEYYEQNFD